MGLVLMILGFMWWWPIGLLVLGFLIARRRRFYWGYPMFAGNGPMCGMSDGMDHGMDRWDRKMARAQEKMDRVRSKMERFTGGADWFRPSTSGNRAFDDYRSETLKRLEDEQREFKDFLERLRFAKDREEFERFMTERRERPVEPGPPSEPPPAPAHN